MTVQHNRLNITALDCVYLPVTDARRSAEWFMKHFGMTEEERDGEHLRLRLSGGASLALIESVNRNTYESLPVHIKCNDARRAHGELVKQAVQCTEAVDWHHYVDFNFRDPDGNPIGVISDPAWAPHPNNYFQLDGIFLGSARFASTLEWYLDVLGTDIEYDFTVATSSSPEARMCYFRGVTFTLFESPGVAVAHKFCDYRTLDAAADHAFLLEKGVRVTPLLSIGTRRGFSFFDPEGREFGLVEG
ncbi:VOC family protein [Cohnella mopanensis]|uniref:VOC family protein n=1 Tax=Cohnella mopanensis TaxID=2911966 RepID=UPI001EF9B602|nr:VOC family protein [Cohnella mopanensis]